MAQRLLFLLIVGFFVTMNVLLWRSEISGRNKPGSPVQVAVVWEKIITAPDNSALEIRHHGQKIGYCQWSPNEGQQLETGVISSAEVPPEGMIQRVSGYTIDLDGGATFGSSDRIRFSFKLELATNHVWTNFFLQIHQGSSLYSARARSVEQLLNVQIGNGGQLEEQVLSFAELRHPERLLGRLGGPLLAELTQAMGFSPSSTSNPSLDLGLEWEARHDWMTIGHARVRAYRLQARLFDRFQVVVLVSHVGEIFRIQLPDEIVFVNQALNL